MENVYWDSTDGVVNMTGHLSGIVAKLKNVGHLNTLSTY